MIPQMTMLLYKQVVVHFHVNDSENRQIVNSLSGCCLMLFPAPEGSLD